VISKTNNTGGSLWGQRSCLGEGEAKRKTIFVSRSKTEGVPKKTKISRKWEQQRILTRWKALQSWKQKIRNVEGKEHEMSIKPARAKLPSTKVTEAVRLKRRGELTTKKEF